MNYTTIEQTKKGLRAAQSSVGVIRAELETLAGRVGVNENAIDVLNGTGAGSVSKSISDAIDAVVDGAPDTFDTLKELADWIADDQTGAAAMAADIANKVDKVEGKGLSANDYTETDKTKLTGLADIKTVGKGLSLDANGNLVATGGGVADAVAWENVTGKPDFATVATSGAYGDLSGTPELATVATSGAYSDLSGAPVLSEVATSGDYADLDNAPALAAVATSGAYSDLTGTPDLAAVATTGDYDDLTGTPTIPTNVSDLTNDAGYQTASDISTAIAGKVDAVSGKGLSTEDYTTAEKNKLTGMADIKSVGTGLSLDANGNLIATGGGVADEVAWENVTGKPAFADVATSGDYSDLTGTPELATVATTGAYSDLAGTPTIPTVPTNVSAFTNDAGYVTSADITTAIDGKVDKVEGKGLSTEDYTTAEKTKLAGLSNYDDTALAGRVTAAETALTGKADTADLATVATSGSYDDLSDKPAAYELPTASDTTLGGIKVNSTSGATVEDGVLKVTQQSGTGGGAIPAYIVGDTMTSGWLSETENGTALTPVDKQEYVIMTSGEWLRKHVMWVADPGVYRLTGKVETADEVLDSYIIGETESDTTLTGLINPVAVPFRELTITRGMKQITVSGSGRPTTATFIRPGDYTYLKKDGEIIITAPAHSASDVWNVPMPTGTIELTDEDVGKKIEWCLQRADSRTEVNYTINLHIVTNTIFDDYETDDVIDITESEIETIWGETAGAADPTNNVFSTEERLWGYWIDGKPIYRITITDTFNNPAENGTIADKIVNLANYGISNVENIVKIAGTLIHVDNEVAPLPWTHLNNLFAIVQCNKTAVRFRNTYKADGTLTTIVTLYYTKTT